MPMTHEQDAIQHKTFTLTKWQTISAVIVMVVAGGGAYVGGWMQMPERVSKLEAATAQTHDALIEIRQDVREIKQNQADVKVDLKEFRQKEKGSP